MITPSALREKLNSNNWVENPFETLGLLAGIVNNDPEIGRELTIRALDKRELLADQYRPILDEITANTGLHPYIDHDLSNLSTRTALIHAAHEAEGEMAGYVVHSAQARILSYLVAGESVVLSAPTSFGKSLLIDLTIASKDFKNVVLIVPTLALVEETRRRMARFSNRYSIITATGQTQSEKNIFVLTQERYLSMRAEISSVDFFAIDEFYKLSISDDGARSTQLNEALLHLIKVSPQFFMLGPSIHAIPEMASERLNCRFVFEKFQTVVTELIPLSKEPSKHESLAKLLAQTEGQTLIYCQSPASTRKLLADYLKIRDIPLTSDRELLEAADWTSRNYHDQWLVSVALKHGIGIHHGRLPRALARFMVRAFERRLIDVLLCTSTLIEGVNTSAKNVVVFDNKLGGNTKKHLLDFFTFNNIRGRSGRMFEHFIGNVYYFDEPPQEELPFVDIPAVNPTDATPSSLLLQMRESDIPLSLIGKFESLRNNGFIEFEQLRSISGIEPELAIDTARYLYQLPLRSLLAFSWSNRPQYDDIKTTSEVIWEHMGGSNSARRAAVFSASMMTFWLWELYKSRNVKKFRRTMIASQIQDGKEPDDAVENVLAFLRSWASFNYPKYLTLLNEIVNVVLSKRGVSPANYLPFATQIEHLFQPTTFSTLEEYGLPVEIAQSLVDKRVFSDQDSFDDIVSTLRRSDLVEFGENQFEKGMIDDFQLGISGKPKEI
ncbi:DEAD/DEAH box helicase [Flavobacterium sp.]|uniref:DEAD/DEAH box helicase n=1 Tax=Flavobacterium sp. TaxID=239 RepID=UPI00260F63B7|nr:DEAD/DEAH box helicase [Flavobacterium sp.]